MRHASPSMRLLALPVFILAGRFSAELLPTLRAVPPAVVYEPIPPRSRSLGRTNHGRLLHGRRLPASGYGYFHIQPERGRLYGTDELVAGLKEAAARLRRADPFMPPLAVGNLSAAGGGRVARHRSHQNGRDADFGFFLLDAKGRPLTSRRFVAFNASDRARLDGRTVYFDGKRNWALIKALMTSPHFGDDVQFIFVSREVRAKVLAQAARQGEPKAVRLAAARLLRQPSGDPHAEHFHLRIGCSPRDLAGGCRDL